MNLSRPLLKAISDMKFVHPTPIQAATIPVALLGKNCLCFLVIIKSSSSGIHSKLLTILLFIKIVFDLTLSGTTFSQLLENSHISYIVTTIFFF